MLGSAVVNALAHDGHQIRILIRRNSAIRGIALECEKSFGDIISYDAVHEAIQDCQAVIHAAAITKQSGISFDQYEKINVGGTINVLTAAMKNGNVRMVHVSTASTIRFGSKKDPGNEMYDADQDFGSGYIKSKIRAEKEIQEAVRSRGANVIIVNPTFMIGPAGNRSSSGELLDFTSRHKNLPCPPGGKNFVDVDDVAFCIAKALTHGKPGERYLIASENFSYAEFFRLIGSAQRKRKYIIEIPRPLWMAAQNIVWAYENVIGASLGINSIMMEISGAETYYTGEKAKEAFGVAYRHINELLKKRFHS